MKENDPHFAVTVEMLRKKYDVTFRRLTRLATYFLTQVLFVIYSGALLFEIKASYLMWFIWGVYQLFTWLHFILMFADLAKPDTDDEQD